MRDCIRERTIKCAQYIIEHRATLRQTAKVFGIGKSTVHTDMNERLAKLDMVMYREVTQILRDNHETRHIRGGESTRRKYMCARAEHR